MAYYNRSKDDEGFGGIISIITVLFSLVLIGVILGRSMATTRSIIVENSSLTSYIEAAEKLKLDYKIENSGDKKKIIISLAEN